MNAEIMIQKKREKWIEIILLSLVFMFAVDILDMAGIIISAAVVFCFFRKKGFPFSMKSCKINTGMCLRE